MKKISSEKNDNLLAKEKSANYDVGGYGVVGIQDSTYHGIFIQNSENTILFYLFFLSE